MGVPAHRSEAPAWRLVGGVLGFGLFGVGQVAQAQDAAAVVSQAAFDGLSAVVVALALLACFVMGFKLGRGSA